MSDDTSVSRIDEIIYLINKERMINKVVSTMYHSGRIYEFRFWLDTCREEEFMTLVKSLNSADPNFVKPEVKCLEFKNTKIRPPTLFKLNDFTEPF